MKPTIKQPIGDPIARIPNATAPARKIHEGCTVDPTVRANALPLRQPQTHYTLDDLLAGITPENQHGEILTGAPIGKELL